jgi:hypothetical protein
VNRNRGAWMAVDIVFTVVSIFLGAFSGFFLRFYSPEEISNLELQKKSQNWCYGPTIGTWSGK